MIPGSFYIRDNVYDVSAVKDGNYLGKTPDAEKIAENVEKYGTVSASEPFACRCHVVAEPVGKAYKTVLKSAGASLRRDGTDKRIVREVRKGTVTYRGSVTDIPGIIDSEDDVM